jgi:cytoskeleton protein RodZ
MRTQPVAPRDLPSVRQKRGVSLEEIATATKIRLHHLQAIERGDYAKLPGGVYNVSYIRQYARAIGCDENDLLGEYRRRTAAAPVRYPAD